MKTPVSVAERLYARYHWPEEVEIVTAVRAAKTC